MPCLSNIGLLACCKAEGGQGELHLIRDAALCWEGATITWVGEASALSAEQKGKAWDAKGKLVVPGLIDCHTHLAFAGDRLGEFARRVKGETYLQIAQSGGGIRSTVSETRKASHQALIDKALPVLSEMLKLGVTSIEAKSGYGLSVESELKLLEVYRELERLQPLEISATLLAAHTLPAEYADDRTGYVRLVIEELLPQVVKSKLASACDVFAEQSAFTIEEARQILSAAKRLGLDLHIHADQLSAGGGGLLAAELSARSADHVEHTSDAELLRMAQAGVVGVTLPFASLYTFDAPLDARRLLSQGVEVAVATDYNPGTAPSYHLPAAMLLACTLNRLSPAEALKGATIIAAKVLGRERQVGSLEVGKQSDFAVIDAPSVEHWLSQFRAGYAALTVKAGQVVHGEPSLTP